MKALTKAIHCYLDSASGQYIPKRFARETVRACLSGVKPEDLDYLARGPGGCLDEDDTLAEGETVRGEFYWETWDTVLDNAILTCPDSGIKFKLWNGESGDIFLVPEDWEWDDEANNYTPPRPDMPADEFTAAYIEALLFASTDESTPQGGEPLDSNYDVSDFMPDELAKIIRDCKRFQDENAADLVEYPTARAGHDFFLTRCGHGAGFWENDFGTEAQCEHLTAACKAFGESNPYVGDDGRLYLCEK